ncbi:hypothetical protein [Azospirillum endophyticum]
MVAGLTGNKLSVRPRPLSGQSEFMLVEFPKHLGAGLTPAAPVRPLVVDGGT